MIFQNWERIETDDNSIFIDRIKVSGGYFYRFFPLEHGRIPVGARPDIVYAPWSPVEVVVKP